MEPIFLIITFILGLMVGSFLNVCIYRIPTGLSIVIPPSRCSSCNTQLKPLDLVPIFSWLFLLGKCRHCKVKISIRYLLVELLTGGLYVLVYCMVGLSLYLIPALILTSLLIAITFIDIDTQTIPNGLVIFGLICALICVFTAIAPAANDGYWYNALDALYGALVGFAPLFIVNVVAKLILKRDGMGGGDMKLMIVVGLFLGLQQTIIALILAIYMGGIVGAIILLVSRYKSRKDTENDNEDKKPGHYMPFGPFLALGSFISMLFGAGILQWYINLLS
ncbi:MAG: prepilin peptidase [Clostridiales bacterium]|nr:prepilin peptidase [Clostridiales bacterium]